MFRKILTTFLMALILSVGIKPAFAETVVERISRTGNLVVGTPFGLVPYAYNNPNEELDGYSIDVVKQIQKQLELRLDEPIQLSFVEVNNISDAVSKILTGEIDIACNTVFTWQRDQFVDYTLGYTQSDIRLLIPKGKQLDNFSGKKIGIPPLTFVYSAISLNHPDATLVEVETTEEGLQALKEGKIDALAGDAIILDGESQQAQMTADFELFPKGAQGYGNYGVSCIVPENNSTFLNVANYAIARMMEGYLVGNEEMTTMVNRWLGEDGVVTIVTKEDLKTFFRNTINNYEQIPFDN